MEDALREVVNIVMTNDIQCLNPCSNGRCSARDLFWCRIYSSRGVLILVLMEDALRDFHKEVKISEVVGLNPCSNGRCSAS